MPNLLAFLSDTIRDVKIKSVVDRLAKCFLWVIAIVVIGAIFKLPDWLLIVLLSFAFLLLVLFGGLYIYFSIKSPNYLRSEEYNLQMRSMELSGSKDKMEPQDISHIPNLDDPYQYVIENKEEE